MGYLSTFISQQIDGHQLPLWFIDKYKEKVLFLEGTLIASKNKTKLLYDNTFFEDYQQALIDISYFFDFKNMIITVLSETGITTQVTITPDNIKYHLMIPHNEMNSVYYQ